MGRRSPSSPKIHERSVRMASERVDQHGWQWAAIRSISEKFGCRPETLRRWVERPSGRRASVRV